MIKFSVISPTATYNLSRIAASADEGGAITITVHTTGVQTGQPIAYTITGISADDIDQPLTGTFTIMNGVASKLFNVNEDLLVEGDEIFTLSLDDAATSISVTIHDTTTTFVKSQYVAPPYGTSTGGDFTWDTGGSYTVVTAPARSTGKYYFEITSSSTATMGLGGGICDKNAIPPAYNAAGFKNTSSQFSYGNAYGGNSYNIDVNTVWGVAINLDNMTAIVNKGGVISNINLQIPIGTEVVAFATTWSNRRGFVNLGYYPFTYPVPSGYEAGF